MLFIDFSSAFNAVIPSKLNVKLGDLGTLCFDLVSDLIMPEMMHDWWLSLAKGYDLVLVTETPVGWTGATDKGTEER